MLLRIQMQENPAGKGGYCVQVAGIIAKGQWSRQQRERSSTWRELMAAYLVLAAYIKHLRGKTIKHRTDNQNTERILVIGSRNWQFNIYKICKDKDIDQNDYMLNTNIFVAFDILWGPHTVDKFA